MYENYSDLCSVATGAFGLANLQDLLGIVVLILSILNILINLALRIYHKIKERKYNQIPTDINNAIDEINKIKEEEKNE